MKNFETLENMETKQQAAIMRIRRMKRLFDSMENEIIALTNTVNCKCTDNDPFSLDNVKCNGSCKNFTLDEAIEKVEKFIDFNIDKEYRE